ncbi:hypothetical protein ACWEKT_39730 [Nocardia takedensis]
MGQVDDLFDLDIRLSVGTVGANQSFQGVVNQNETDQVNTCGIDCITQTCPSETCGCNTAETCDQHLEGCGFPFTFGQYCEDETDETCGCAPGETADCGDATDDC